MAFDRPRPKTLIEFIDLTDTENADVVEPSTYTMPEITDTAKIQHRGKEIKIDTSKLRELKILGRGCYAENVMLCEVANHPDLQIAVKRLALLPSTTNPGDFTAQTDLKTIQKIGSGENPHVTKFYAGLRDKELCQLIICMEPCDASMDRFSTQMHKMKLTEHLDLFLRRMIRDIADALRYLKSQSILHRDVKPSNILINQDPVIFKLCDFGICGQMINSVSHTMMKGTQIYLAPERIDGRSAPEGYGIQSDMWALGLSVLEIASDEHPFAGLAALAIMEKVKTWIPIPPPSLSSDLEKLIIWLLKVDRQNRPANYDVILSSPTIESVPTEVTRGEKDMVIEVIEHLPPIRDHNEADL